METCDFLGEQVVTTPVGPVALSLAGHEDGSLSVVAWLMPPGRRVGWIACRPRQRQPHEEQIDPVLNGTPVRSLMVELLAKAHDQALCQEPIGRRLVRAGLLSDDDLDDLLGWQWLLAEMGQPRRLGELAVAAGLLSEDAVETIGVAVIERRAPNPPPALVLSDAEAAAVLA
jgi:hypothetical protein